ncbi:hypothetical protein KUCAC02_033673, partial [Chaenocephalus aceratus]
MRSEPPLCHAAERISASEASAKDDGVDLDALAAEIEGPSKEPKGKKKKKGVKKEDYDEEEVLKELEELSLEAHGGRAKTEEAEVAPPPAPQAPPPAPQAPPPAPPSDSDDGNISRFKTKKQTVEPKKEPEAPPPQEAAPIAAAEEQDEAEPMGE